MRYSTPAAGPTRVFGVETEYGFASLGPDGMRLDPFASVDALAREIRAQVPFLYCGAPCDLFTVNGSRVYIDAGLHPEVATPECSSPEEVVRFTRAGDRLLARAASALARSHRGVDAVVWKGNVDHRSRETWGSHESYLHRVPQEVLSKQLITHLVTRVIYTGAGGFDCLSPRLRFVVSPRAMHLRQVVSRSSTGNRGIFHTRDEPLAAPPNRRLHVLAGESLWSQTADFLRIGVTALLVAQVDAGREPQRGLDLDSSLEALATVARDVDCETPVRLASGVSLTAIAIQRRLLEGVEADLHAGHLPAWAAPVCRRWREVLDALQISPASLIGVLDWPTKLAMLRRQCEARGVAWTFSTPAGDDGDGPGRTTPAAQRPDGDVTARLLETDMRFNRLDERGIFFELDRRGALAHRVVSDAGIERAVCEPPATGRARARSACVRRLAARADVVTCRWDQIVDHEKRERLSLTDPFQDEEGRWEPLPPEPHRVGRPVIRNPQLASEMQPIHAALQERAPRVALRRMRALLGDAQPPTREARWHCHLLLARHVPTVPVPELDWGMATAGPVLEALLACARRAGDTPLESQAATLLYRFHEARGDFAAARRVIASQLVREEEAGRTGAVALLVNNLAYEHLLAGEFAEAQPLFERAQQMFQREGRHDEAASVQANVLECQFGLLEPPRWRELVPTLTATNRRLTELRDWRARKTLMLLARLARQRGRTAAAVAWARRALVASERVPTRLRHADRAFLRAVENERGAAAD